MAIPTTAGVPRKKSDRRPAKVGEWVYPLKDSVNHDRANNAPRYRKGELLECTGIPAEPPWGGLAIMYNGTWDIIEHTNYLVLDGYAIAPPKYNGKVICTNLRGGHLHTVGKTYTVKDGLLSDDTKTPYNTTPFATFEDLCKFTTPRFVRVVE